MLLEKFKSIRRFTEKICEPLEIEDYVIQSMPDMSPTKWHLAHTSWFFETFVLSEINHNYNPFNDKYAYLFNSYYVQAGDQFYRPHRGVLSRPTVKDVFEYRKYVDDHMKEYLTKLDNSDDEKMKLIVEIGLNHEQQHQELMLTDIKHLFSMNPLYPVLKSYKNQEIKIIDEINWVSFKEGVYEIGYSGNDFYYDNEKPVHKQYIKEFAIADRLITNQEFIDFIDDKGYERAELWLSEGFAFIENEGISAPAYWRKIDNKWMYYTLNGFREIELNEPVCHVSHFEADAYARWANARLTTEGEWELASKGLKIDGNFVDADLFHPSAHFDDNKVRQMYGNVWEWTQSNYLPYPGYKVPAGAIGEYNGKFMSNQMVLRGGSCATSRDHIRNTYRNFFPSHARWQFSGIRLAKDID